jgi:hypothetical protein
MPFTSINMAYLGSNGFLLHTDGVTGSNPVSPIFLERFAKTAGLPAVLAAKNLMGIPKRKS